MLLSLILGTLRDHCCRNMLPHDLKLCQKLSISQRSRESSGTGSNFFKIKISYMDSCVKGHSVAQTCHLCGTHKLLGQGEVNDDHTGHRAPGCWPLSKGIVMP